jgi:hypothetical protein
VLITLVAPSVARAQVSDRSSESAAPAETFTQFWNDTVRSPFPYVYAVTGASFDHLAGFPAEWGGASGFSERVAARVGEGWVADSIAHGAAALARQQITYDPCRCTGKVPRAKHAVSRAFMTVRNDGRTVPNWPLWLSKYSSAAVATAWYPDSYSRREILVQATSAIAISAGINVLREFAHFR